tara:strand:- start:410 stop:853 length:444 start_codon:yes stop_codon:yes gene_type:complete
MAVDLRVSDTAGKVASRATPKITGLTGPSSLTSRVTGGVHKLKTTPFTTEGVKMGQKPKDDDSPVKKSSAERRGDTKSGIGNAIASAAEKIGIALIKKQAPLELGISGLTTADIPANSGFFSSPAPSDFTASLAMMNEGGFVKKRNT